MRVGRPRIVRSRAELLVRLRPDEPLRTTHALAERVLGALPGLRDHECRNDEGLTFAEEAAATEVAHLFEHVLLEIMRRAGVPGVLEGETTWDVARDGRGVFAVTVPCDDPCTCRQAARLATRVMRSAIAERPMPALDARIERIARARGDRRHARQV